jgi:hypothetical protein
MNDEVNFHLLQELDAAYPVARRKQTLFIGIRRIRPETRIEHIDAALRFFVSDGLVEVEDIGTEEAFRLTPKGIRAIKKVG